MVVHLVAEDKVGHMVALENDRITSVPIAEAVAQQKFVPLDGDIVLTAFGLDICLGNSQRAIEQIQRR